MSHLKRHLTDKCCFWGYLIMLFQLYRLCSAIWDDMYTCKNFEWSCCGLFKLLSQHSPGKPEKNNEKHESGQPETYLRFETGISQSITATLVCPILIKPLWRYTSNKHDCVLTSSASFHKIFLVCGAFTHSVVEKT